MITILVILSILVGVVLYACIGSLAEMYFVGLYASDLPVYQDKFFEYIQGKPDDVEHGMICRKKIRKTKYGREQCAMSALWWPITLPAAVVKKYAFLYCTERGRKYRIEKQEERLKQIESELDGLKGLVPDDDD